MIRRLWVVVAVLGCGGGGDDDDGGGPLTQDQLTDACISLTGCLGVDGVNDCFTDSPAMPIATLRCLAAAGARCDAVLACLPYTFVIDPSCTTAVSSCAGDDMVVCGDGVRVTTRCGDLGTTGPTCVSPMPGDAYCAVATCAVDATACAGDVVQECDAARGVLRALDCADYGLGCINGACSSPGGGGACTTTGEQCSGTAIQTCEGAIDVRYECSSWLSGSTCHAVTIPFPDAYCGPAADCYPEKGTETCNGTALTFCAAGVVTTVDCVAAEFSTCEASPIFGGRCRP